MGNRFGQYYEGIMASWGVRSAVNAVCFVRNEGEGLRWSMRCSERACKRADALARAGKAINTFPRVTTQPARRSRARGCLLLLMLFARQILTLRQLDLTSSYLFTFRPEALLSLPNRNPVYPINSTEPR